MSKIRRASGWLLVGGALLMHSLTVWCYTLQPDSLAGFTVLPLWFWGIVGVILSLLAFVLLRAPLPLTIAAAWVVTMLVAMDESRGFLNLDHPHITQGRRPTGDRNLPIRIATVNCAIFRFGNPSDDLKKWDPDIVLIQQVAPQQTQIISESLYGDAGNWRAHATNGIATRYEILREVSDPAMRNQQVTVRLPDGQEIEVVNVHLATAATDMRLWSHESRAAHRSNRALRRAELSKVLEVLTKTSGFPHTPTILGGDFNAGATDIVHRQLDPSFNDAFSQVGRGWGDTFHRRFPVLRIDHIYATPAFQPLSAGTAVSKSTDHRMVIADFIFLKKTNADLHGTPSSASKHR